MGTTVLGTIAATLPLELEVPFVEIKRTWSAGWEIEPELELVSFRWCAAGQDLGSCELRRRYGRLKHPWETGLSPHYAWDLDNWWVRVRVATRKQITLAWIGRISSQGRELFGNSVANSGIQSFTAYAPDQILRKTPVSCSYWCEGSTEAQIGWLPAFNSRDSLNRLVGNRTAQKSSGTFCFGGTRTWTRYEILEYLVQRFLNANPNMPTWSIGGQADLLKGVSDTITLDRPITVAQALRKVIPTSLGIDYTVVPTASGFEISVYALVANEYSFNGQSLPRNPNTVRIQLAGAIDRDKTTIVKVGDQQYGTIRIIGQRIVLCESLDFDTNKLEAKWTTALANTYKQGTGTEEDEAAAHDAARMKEIFRPVYQMFGAPAGQGFSAPVLDAEGNLTTDDADFQTIVRETLPWLPLREGVDYSESAKDEEESHNPSSFEAPLLPPMAWIVDWGLARFVPVDQVGISLSVLPTEWGVLLGASPNHRLAKFAWSEGQEPYDTEWDPDAPQDDNDKYYDYEDLVITIAYRLDQPVMMSYDVPGGGDGSTKEIFDPGAELWLLAPYTATDIDANGYLIGSGSDLRVLRNDSQRMALLMAGAIARYAEPRARANLVLKGVFAWTDLVGQILTVVDSGEGDLHDIQAPITSVELTMDGNTPLTTIKTGYAK